jgi:transcriptional regulator with XRE-family HTH domain/tetratricopeptide (TPR) repeat protein
VLIGDRRVQDRVDTALWQRPDMRAALAARDIAGVFRLLQRVGVSQRRIAALTGQSQSEISEILGGRHVVSYDVLARIADGLGVPRGHLGLAYDDATAQLVGVASEGVSPPDDEDPNRLVARVTQMTMGEVPVDPRQWAQPMPLAWARAPDHVGLADVSRLEGVTAQLRAMDYEFGGGACRDAVLAQLAWAQQLLVAQVGETATRALHVAVADLHSLAGWTSFDVGMIGPARRHMSRALEHARFADEQSLVARVLYALGRVHLHHGWHGQALRLFQLGLVQAQQTEYGRAEALLHANLGWAHAANGDPRQALASAERAREAYTRSEPDEVPHWLRFFDSAELQALRGMTLAYLPDPTPEQRAQAIERFTWSNAMRELPLARSRAFELTALSWLLLDEGAVEQAVQVGNQAVDLAEHIKSQRVVDRFAPLRAGLASRLATPDVRDLAERVRGLRGAVSPPTQT